MQRIARRFFATEAAAELEKTAAEKATQLQKQFSEECAAIMKTRGHHKLQMGTVVSKNGSEMKFDFTYGWPFRYYCVCNMGTETVVKLAEFFNVSTDYLLGKSDIRNPEELPDWFKKDPIVLVDRDLVFKLSNKMPKTLISSWEL